MPTRNGKHLNAREARFCREYLIDLNATAAAQRAGYSQKTAGATGARLLKRVHVQARIQKLKADRAERVDIKADRVVQELARLGFSDIRQCFEWDEKGRGRFIPSADLDDDVAAAIAAVECDPGTGKLKLKMWDKNAALLQLGRHLAMFTDNTNATTRNYVLMAPPGCESVEDWEAQHGKPTGDEESGK